MAENVPNGDRPEQRGAAEWIAASGVAAQGIKAIHDMVRRPKDPPSSSPSDEKK